jgi:hypothetical protein
MSRGSKKPWSELSRRQRGVLVSGGAIQLILLAVAVADLWRRPPDQVNGPKPLWLAISLVNFVGPLAYLRVRPQALITPLTTSAAWHEEQRFAGIGCKRDGRRQSRAHTPTAALSCFTSPPETPGSRPVGDPSGCGRR